MFNKKKRKKERVNLSKLLSTTFRIKINKIIKKEDLLRW